MKFLLILLFMPLTSLAMEILIPESGGESTADYTDTGWDMGSSSTAMSPWARCQGNDCPQIVYSRIGFNSQRVYDFLASKSKFNAQEIAYRLGYDPSIDNITFNAVVLIINEIKSAQGRNEPKELYSANQTKFIATNQNRQTRLLKARIFADLSNRIAP